MMVVVAVAGAGAAPRLMAVGAEVPKRVSAAGPTMGVAEVVDPLLEVEVAAVWKKAVGAEPRSN